MPINFPTFYDGEVPSGTFNGSNTSFTLAHAPYGNIELFWNGVMQQPDLNYSLSGSSLSVLTTPPGASDSFLADYIVNDGSSVTPTEQFVDDETPFGAIDGSNVTFTLAETPVTGSVKLYRNGLRQDPSADYSISGGTITMSIAPQSGDWFTAYYRMSGDTETEVSFVMSSGLSGVFDGGNNVFFVAEVPYPFLSLRLYYNGELQDPLSAQYNQIFNSIGFVDPPTTDSSLLVSYRYESEVPPDEMATFPTLGSGSMKVYGPLLDQALAMYPATITNSYVTRVIRFVSDQEQRFTVRAAMFYAILEYQFVNGYDFALINDFFNEQLGKFAVVNVANPSESTTFSITIGGVTYDNCAFDQDTLEPQLGRGETYSFQLAIKQLVSTPST